MYYKYVASFCFNPLLFPAELTARNPKPPGTPQTPIQVGIPVAATVAIASSTPNPSMLTPLSTNSSPLSDATIVAALAQMKQGTSSMPNSPQQSVVSGLTATPVPCLGSPVPTVTTITPGSTPTTPGHAGIASPQTTSIPGRSPLPPLAVRQTTSPMSVAKSILHGYCPSTQQGALSPLLKVASSPVQSGNSGAVGPTAHVTKSPGRKIVTVSKLPTSEQISVILQQLQNSPHTATAELSKIISSATNSLNSGQVINGSGGVNGNASQPTSAHNALLSSLTSGGSVEKTSQSCLVTNGQ